MLVADLLQHNQPLIQQMSLIDDAVCPSELMYKQDLIFMPEPSDF